MSKFVNTSKSDPGWKLHSFFDRHIRPGGEHWQQLQVVDRQANSAQQDFDFVPNWNPTAEEMHCAGVDFVRTGDGNQSGAGAGL